MNKRCGELLSLSIRTGNDNSLRVHDLLPGVEYSVEYDVCDVTLSVYPHRASLKNMPDHGGKV